MIDEFWFVCAVAILPCNACGASPDNTFPSLDSGVASLTKDEPSLTASGDSSVPSSDSSSFGQFSGNSSRTAPPFPPRPVPQFLPQLPQLPPPPQP